MNTNVDEIDTPANNSARSRSLRLPIALGVFVVLLYVGTLIYHIVV